MLTSLKNGALATCLVAAALSSVACSSKKKDAATEFGNSITRDLTKDQLGKIRKRLEAGEDVSYAKDCRPLKDLAADLKKDTAEESKKLLKDIDTFCTYEIPAKTSMTVLDKDLASVKEHGNEDFWVKFLVDHCKSADDDLKKAEADGAKDAPMVAALAKKKAEDCTPENTTAKAAPATATGKKKKK